MSRVALIVGINSYDHFPTLASPCVDAEGVASLLEKYSDFKVIRLTAEDDGANHSLRLGQRPRLYVKELKKELEQLFTPNGRTIPDSALFFFSGHGWRTESSVPEGFLATSETWPYEGVNGLSMDWLRRLLQKSEVRQQVVWLDCCFSGELLNMTNADPGYYGQCRDRCFIAASREFEEAFEYPGGRHGVFTKALLEGLNTNRLLDGLVTNYDLCAYISKNMIRAPQAPVFHNFGEVVYLTQDYVQQAKTILPLQEMSCPYRGLKYFDFNDVDPHFFFGRLSLTDLIIERVRTNNFISILGPSGSGKSSVVRAGLLYQLKLGHRLSGSETWIIKIFRPGEHPLNSLAKVCVDKDFSNEERDDQLKNLKELIEQGAIDLNGQIQHRRMSNDGPGRLVLVIDQFEEVFTLCDDLKERSTFFRVSTGFA